MTTRLFLGSTAPTAISGVSTTATSFGGAVRTAARPNRTAKPDPAAVDTGVPILGDGLTGVIGVCGEVAPILSDNLPLRLTPDVELPSGDFTLPARESLRCGVAREEVDRARVGEMPVRTLGLSVLGVRGDADREGSVEVPAVAAGCAESSSSVHWRCRMTDFVAH